mgnify:CR=1 FL=1
MASIWDKLFPDHDYRTLAPAGGYADLYANGLLGDRTDAPASVEAMQTGKDFIPGIGDAIALKEAYDAASRGDKVAAGLLATAAALGLIPGAGDAIARPILAAGRKMSGRNAVDAAPSPLSTMPSAAIDSTPSPAQEVAELLSSGRADDVTDEMLGKLTAQDNSELFDLYQSGATGMDLPMDEASRMGRADNRNMIDGLHGTQPSPYDNIYDKTPDNPDIKEFDIDRSTRGQSGKGIYFAPPDNYDLANSFAGGRKLSDADLELLDPNSPKIAGVVYPVKVRADKQADYQQMREAQYAYENQQIAQGKSAGYAGLSDSVPNTLKPQGFSGVSQNHEFTTFYPENVRSRFARFDPRLAHLKNLLAGVGAAPIGLLALREEQKRANEEQYKRGLLQ